MVYRLLLSNLFWVGPYFITDHLDYRVMTCETHILIKYTRINRLCRQSETNWVCLTAIYMYLSAPSEWCSVFKTSGESHCQRIDLKFELWPSDADIAHNIDLQYCFTSEQERNMLCLWNLNTRAVLEPAILNSPSRHRVLQDNVIWLPSHYPLENFRLVMAAQSSICLFIYLLPSSDLTGISARYCSTGWSTRES